MKQGFLIPVYRHGESAGLLAEKLSSYNMPIIIVDDGNDKKTKDLLIQLAANLALVDLVHIEKNSGKGGAVTRGLKRAKELGLSHVLQIDADAQHDIERAAFFLEESVKHPENIICGCPEFDSTAPKSRVLGRNVSTFWAAVVTFSDALKDVLCGFRVYPVHRSLHIAQNPFMSKRMDFDPEIMVRLYWKKVFPLYHPIKIIYPDNGISNFHSIKDNIRISLMFSRLFFEMLLRFPVILTRGFQYRKQKP